MAGCGYVCPLCEGKGFVEIDKPCDYCNSDARERLNVAMDRNNEELTGNEDLSNEITAK